MKKLLLLLVPMAFLLGCSGPEKNARDAIAASKGAIETAQTKYMDQCKADATLQPCTLINRAVAAQNTAINALELYCSGGSVGGAPTFQNGGTCHADKTVQPKLDAAVSDLNQIIASIKGIVQ